MPNEQTEKIRTYIERNLAGRKVTNSETLFEGGAIDSLGHLKLIAFLENEFGITFSMDELDWEKFATVDAISQLVSEKVR